MRTIVIEMGQVCHRYQAFILSSIDWYTTLGGELHRHGVNAPTLVDFKLLMVQEPGYKIPEYFTTSSLFSPEVCKSVLGLKD